MATYCPTHGEDYIMPCVACAAIERVRLMCEANVKNKLPAEAAADLSTSKPMQPIEITPIRPLSTAESILIPSLVPQYNFKVASTPRLGDPAPETEFLKLARSYDNALSQLKFQEEQRDAYRIELDHLTEVAKDAKKIVESKKKALEDFLKGSSDG